ncbi:MAG: hypothetical protein IPH20_11385 [Bacteroidales bacterium]|nr:hypothetical protein [Bacteroidales bacterium]
MIFSADNMIPFTGRCWLVLTIDVSIPAFQGKSMDYHSINQEWNDRKRRMTIFVT